MPIKVTTMVNQTKYLKLSDPDGETYVVIKPPDYQAVMERDELLKNRTVMPGVGTQVSSNLSQLWAVEIWLTYVETNLVVEFEDEDGKITKTIKFEPRDQISRVEFIRRLQELPPSIVYEWHTAIIEVVGDWAVPF